MVGVQGAGQRRRAPRAEVEVSVAPHSPALAPWGTRGWRRRPPSPNEVVQSALCLPVTHLETLAPKQSLVVVGGALLGNPTLPPPTNPTPT